MVVQRRRKRKGGFLVGSAVGLVAGLAGGTALLRRAAMQNVEIQVTVEEGSVSETAVDVARVAQQAPIAVRQRARSSLDVLKQRWQEAVAEGKVAAAEREAELEEQYAQDTKRIAPPTPPSGSTSFGP
jgi:hypothetical protein